MTSYFILFYFNFSSTPKFLMSRNWAFFKKKFPFHKTENLVEITVKK